MENLVNILIYLHAGLGGLALASGLLALLSLKGSNRHKVAGQIFFFSMLSSAVIAILIALLPGHYNPFLFAIGIFTTYMLLAGKRALRFKRSFTQLTWEKTLSWSMIITGSGMILLPLLILGQINIILLVFGLIGLAFGISDLRFFANPGRLRKRWLIMHIGRITGAYISAVTAFMVVNQVLPGMINWFLPTVLGSIYISWWIGNLRRGKITEANIYQRLNKSTN